MTVAEIQVDQRVIGIDSRRFASVEKALVELVTNSDDSYARLERTGAHASGRIDVRYERHHTGAVIMVSDQAEGMSFEQAGRILSYGGAHSPLARGEGDGRGYFGRGLKQAIFGLGHGWIETIQGGRFTRIDVFRGENGGYLYDDGGEDRRAFPADYARLGVDEAPDASGTRVTVVVDNPHVRITQYSTLLESLADNIYLRGVLGRRSIELEHGHPGTVEYHREPVRFREPPAALLLGPDLPGSVSFEGQEYPFVLTLKRATDTELTLKGDERTNGLIVLSGQAVLDCQLFDFENQVGTEYLFGAVRCDALIGMLGRGRAVISDEREGLNPRDPFVASFTRAVSRMLADAVQAEKEKLTHLERATTSGRTAEMIEQLLQHMNEAAVVDLGLETAPEPGPGLPSGDQPAALRFTTPFYYRPPGRPFHVSLLLDPSRLPDGGTLTFEVDLPDSIRMEPAPEPVAVAALGQTRRLEWAVTGERSGGRGEVTARAGDYWALCEIVIAEHASHRGAEQPPHPAATKEPAAQGPAAVGAAATPAAQQAAPQGTAHREGHRPVRDHGVDLFTGYEFRSLHNSADRAVYSSEERIVIINTAAPTVQLYVDGRGRFRDSARLLLAELFLDVIADELARRRAEQHGHGGDLGAFKSAKRDIIRRYGSDVHRTFMG
ncbi:ATP-binding protein [Arthrobacter sp. KBS0702]|uniref:ATP-binding protein n=1 Tax=Arthrobacter sp. KBS0702 TaxID=2578107 RepID=UPI00110D857A|nr:ATP-binding protein [Arthrobacter sp. KBS0702]QDW30878.1 ATP-binding protein [Arthrobacter sp. KBS0702]